MYNTTVTLKKGEGRTLKAGGMWVFDNEIASILGTFENGDIVNIHDFDGYFIRLYQYQFQDHAPSVGAQEGYGDR